MKPVLSAVPGVEVSRAGVGWGARTGDDDVAWLFSLIIGGLLPYLDVGDVGLGHAGGGVALVEDGGDDALPGAIVVGHGPLEYLNGPIRVATYIHSSVRFVHRCTLSRYLPL